MNSSTNEQLGRLKDLLPPLQAGAEGIKKFLHGNLYQIKLTLYYAMYLWLQPSNRKNYCLATEVANGEKFDDLVVYKRNDIDKNKISIMFVQAKHSQNDEKKIESVDLKKGSNANKNPFGLPKYFESYQLIMKEPDFSEYKIEKFYLCTNSDISNDVRMLTTEVSDANEFFLQDSGELRQINPSAENISTIYDELRKVNPFTALVNALVNSIACGKPIYTGSGIYAIYHVALIKERILLKKTETEIVFHEDFIAGTLNNNALEFKSEFIKAYCREKTPTKDVMEELRGKKLKTSKDFGKKFEKTLLSPDFNSTTLASSLFKLVNKDGIIKTMIKCTGKNIKRKEINPLAGHVFVYAEVKKYIKFKEIFFTDSFATDLDSFDKETDLLLLKFKSALEKEIEKANDAAQGLHLKLGDLKKCRFEINNYKSWFEKEPETSLPLNKPVTNAEMDEFFGKFVFAVNQPSESRLSEMITENLKDKYNLSEPKLVTDYMLMKAMDWVNSNVNTYLDGINIDEYFEEGNQQLMKAGLTVFTKSYRARMRPFGNIHEITELTKLLTTKRENVLCICTSNPLFIATMIEPTIMKIDENFKFDDSFIFIDLLFLKSSTERILLAFESGKANLMVVVAEYNYDEIDVRDIAAIGSNLLKIVEKNKEKKLVFISPESNILYTFYESFKKNARKVNLEFESYNDLTKKIVNFQETYVNVVDLIGDTSINPKLKSFICSYKTVKIGLKLKECKNLRTQYPQQSPENEKVLYFPVPKDKKISDFVSYHAQQKKNEFPCFWVAEIKLNVAVKKHKEERISYEDFLCKLLAPTPAYSEFDRQMFQYFCDQRKIILIFDGAAKIKQHDVNYAISLMQNLRVYTRETWIFTTEKFSNKLRRTEFKNVKPRPRNIFAKRLTLDKRAS